MDDDDWETAIIPDLLQQKEQIQIQIQIQKEQKRMEERKQIEEADNILTEELFLDAKEAKDAKDVKDVKEQLIKSKPQIKSKPKTIRQNLMQSQKQKAELIKQKKAEKIRLAELYGTVELDEYYEKYGAIQDKY